MLVSNVNVSVFEQENKEINEVGGDQGSRTEEHSNNFALSVSLKESVEDVEKSSAFVKSIKL